MNALVIDDSRAMRSILKRMLNQLGFDVTEAGDGSEALGQLDSGNTLDLVVVDWNMPVMTGIEFLETIRAREVFDPLKVMFVTTESENEQIRQAMDAGANAYLTKPFTPDRLKAKLIEMELLAA